MTTLPYLWSFDLAGMVGSSTTHIGVKRIVIEVNRDLTVEQLEILDNALKQVGLVKSTKVTFHHHHPQTHSTSNRVRQARPRTHHDFRMDQDTGRTASVSNH